MPAMNAAGALFFAVPRWLSPRDIGLFTRFIAASSVILLAIWSIVLVRLISMEQGLLIRFAMMSRFGAWRRKRRVCFAGG
ncbi:hypothetical protein CAL14_19720 [Bordetella genomosp. 9]|nr:hypothetical protein CAL14_19720 [Bordetella genomosp. 9]